MDQDYAKVLLLVDDHYKVGGTAVTASLINAEQTGICGHVECFPFDVFL